MFGTNKDDDFFAVHLKDMNDVNECLLEPTKAIKSDSTHVINKLILSNGSEQKISHLCEVFLSKAFRHSIRYPLQ